MIDWWHSVTGQQDDTDDPVKKALGLLGQGATAAGQAVSDVGSTIGSAVQPYLPQPSATPAPEDYSTQAMQQPFAPEAAPAAPETGWSVQSALAPAGQAYGSAFEQVNREEDEAARRNREVISNPSLQTAIAPLEAARRAARLGTAAIEATPEAIRETANTASGQVGLGREDVGVDLPLVGRTGITDVALALAPSERLQAVMGAGEYLPAYGRAGGSDVIERAGRAALEAGRGALGRAGEALAGNAERVAAADARMAAEGSTLAPGTLGVISGNPLEASTATRALVVQPGEGGVIPRDAWHQNVADELGVRPRQEPIEAPYTDSTGRQVTRPSSAEWRTAPGPNGPEMVQVRPNFFNQTEEVPGTRRPLDAVYRVISREDYEQSLQRGYLQSDGRLNLDASEGTVASAFEPSSFYSPKNSDAVAIRIRVDPQDGWGLNRHDSYVKTQKPIPVDRIERALAYTTDEMGNPTRYAESPSRPLTNAERVAAADARAAEQGSTSTLGTFGALPRGSNLEARIAAAEARLEHAATRLESADALLAQAADAGSPAELRAARSTYSPARSAYDEAAARVEQLREQQRMVSRDIEGAGYGRPVEDAGIDTSAVPREATSAYPGQPDAVPPFRDDAPRSISLNAGLGAVPEGDRLAGVNRVLGQGLASSVSGGVGAQINQEMNPDDPYAGLKGFAAGALVPPLAARGGMALGRRAGAEARGAEGALAAFGQAPGAGGAPGGGGLLSAFPGLASAYRKAAARNAAEMARKNITPASAVDVVRGAVGSIGHGALLGPSSATAQGAQSLWNLAWSLPKEPIRGAARAASTGNPSALREPGEAASGALMGLGKIGEAVWDVVRGQGRYAPLPGHEPTSARVADPFLRNVLGALETPGRAWAGIPDAIAGTIAEEAVVGRRAAQRATDAGLTGAAWEAEVARLRAEAGQARKQQRAGGRQQAQPADVADVTGAAEEAGIRAGLRQPLGSVGRAARKASGADIPVVGQFLAPYFNTPWNATLQQAERTPAGLVMNTQSSKFDKYYDAIVGTSATIALADQLKKGNITVNGSGPTDPNERQAWTDEGNRPYSVKVGDVYIPNRTFGYAEGVLNAVGEYHDALAFRKPEANTRWVSEDAFRRIGRILKEQPYAAGFSTLYDMAQFGPASLAADLATRATPGAATLRAIGASRDTAERTVDRGANVPLEQEALERWQQSVGMRGDLPVAQDILGRPKENPQQGIAAFLPRIGTAREDPVISVFQDAGVFPGNPPSQLTIPNLKDEALKPDLTPAEQRRWDALRGEMLLASVGPLATDPGWQAAPREVRAKELERRKQEAGQLAHQRLAGEIGADEIKRRIDDKVQGRARRAS